MPTSCPDTQIYLLTQTSLWPFFSWYSFQQWWFPAMCGCHFWQISVQKIKRMIQTLSSTVLLSGHLSYFSSVGYLGSFWYLCDVLSVFMLKWLWLFYKHRSSSLIQIPLEEFWIASLKMWAVSMRYYPKRPWKQSKGPCWCSPQLFYQL